MMFHGNMHLKITHAPFTLLKPQSLSLTLLKALVNIVFSKKNLSCMVLNTIRIFDRVQKLSCENIMLQSYHLVLQKCENLKYHLHRPLC